MAKTTNGLKELKINYLSEELYKEALESGNIRADELYMTPANKIGIANDSTPGTVKSGTGIFVDSEGNVSVNDNSHNHVISNVDGLQEALDSKSAIDHTHDDRYYTESEVDAKLNTKLNTSLKGMMNGLAELDANGRVPSSQLPSYVDDVIEGYLYNSKFYKESAHTTEITGETGKIYVDLTSNKTYRWSGSAFTIISETLALGETSTTAYRGDRGKIAYDHSQVAHAPSNAEVNQNAFSNIVVGSTTIAADSKTDTLTLVAGSNVTITPDDTNDKITISSTDTNTWRGIQDNLTSTSTTDSLSANQGRVLKTLVDGKSPSDHTHNYAGSSSAGGVANSAVKATQDSAGQQINTTYIKGLSVSGRTITYTKGDGSTDTITTQDTNTTYSNATTSAAGLMSASDKSKLDGIAENADAVSFSQSLTSGTKVGTLTINGTGTDLYCQTNTDTHYASKNVVGSSTSTSNTTSALSNGNVYLNSVENGSITSSHKISGSGATSVITDTSGNIIISSTDTNTVTTVSTTGSGNAVTSISADNGTLTVTKGSTFLTTHPTITIDTDSTSTASPIHGGAFTAIDSITIDSNGHVTKVNTKTITLPTDNNTDTKVQTVITNPTSATTYYVPFATGATTGTLAINDGFKVNSLQGTADAEGYDRISLGNNTTTGTAGNKSGGLQMYGTNSYYTLFRTYNQSASVTKYLVGTSSDAAAGSSTKPVYVSNTGTVTACTYTLEKSVPSDAVFTDTVYTHPTSSGNKHIPSGGSSNQILRWSDDGTAVWGDENNTTYSTGTASTAGLTKLYTSTGISIDGTMTRNAITTELNNKTAVKIVRWS